MGIKEKEEKRHFLITINNYTESDIAQVKNYPCDYGILCREVCPKTGTPHIHALLFKQNKTTFTAIKKKIHRANLRPIDSIQATITYIKGDVQKKEGLIHDFEEWGIPPKGQGKRTDLENIKEIVQTTGKMAAVVLEAKSYQSIKMAEQILKYHEKKRMWVPEVYWLYGEAGSGKTRYVYDRHKLDDIYVSMSNLKWWEGYDGHEVVILDDFRKNSCSYQELLRILDRYPYRVENKGGSRQLLAKTIYVSSPFHPKDLYKDLSEDIQQLLRRIKEIILFGEYKEQLLQNEFSEL